MSKNKEHNFTLEQLTLYDQVLTNVRNLYKDSEHWCQGTRHRYDRYRKKNQYCIKGAILKGLGKAPDIDLIEDYKDDNPLASIFIDTLSRSRSIKYNKANIIDFNDSPHRTISDVRKLCARVHAKIRKMKKSIS